MKIINHEENASESYNEKPLGPVRMISWSRYKFFPTTSVSWELLGPFMVTWNLCEDKELPEESMPPLRQLWVLDACPTLSLMLSTPATREVVRELQPPLPLAMNLSIASASLPWKTAWSRMLRQIKFFLC